MLPSPFSLERQIVFLFPKIHWRLRYGSLYGCAVDDAPDNKFGAVALR